MSYARWTWIEPVFTAWRAAPSGPGTAAGVHDLREIANAIPYVERNNCGGKAPTWSTAPATP
ncbi:hypothetical protein [Streptomyces sp. NPDC000880]